MTRQRARRRNFRQLQMLYQPVLDRLIRAGEPLPTDERLRALGQEHLLRLINRHGGIPIVHRRLGYWTPGVAYRYVAHLCQDDVFASRQAVLDAGLGNVVSGIRRAGYAWRDLAAAVGMQTNLARLRRQQERRFRAAQRLLYRIAKRTRRLPNYRRLTPRVRDYIDHQGGIRRLLREFLLTECPAADQSWLAPLVVRPTRKPWGFWRDESRLRRDLEPYIQRYLDSYGTLRVVRALRDDGRFDLANAIKHHDRKGILALFDRWGVPEELQVRRLEWLKRRLVTAYPELALQRILPSRTRLLKERLSLHVFIVEHCGGYGQAARVLGFQTAREARYLTSRRHKLRVIGELILRSHGLPPPEAFHTKLLATVKNARRGVRGFLAMAGRDPVLRTDLAELVARLRDLARNGATPDERVRLMTVANELCHLINGHGE